MFGDLRALLSQKLLPVRETTLLLLGKLGRGPDRDLGDVFELLIQQLGSGSSPLRSLAYTQVHL